ncbi:uncharacterized protein LOC110099143 [Dendrobium catenatum]|uniref:DUF3511 domain protein n=2 Tax=Dendrobium TaxID=37818 RepID=A0A8T3BAX1_DENNO|nr:uncharacterized protein LOC110099143 [Dendrobium catenatum]KAI0508025.1 hypothetical protein KFK09_014159 [Dendrobium nobile]PKU63228.1 hypothetical protein MA16_Dca011201 [Dendrobium catenatum]
MEDMRSRSYADGRMQIEPYGIRGPAVPSYDLRSYSTSDASSYSQKETKLNKSKNLSSFKGGWLNDPELQRKKRVAGYKVYSVEGKVKGSFRKSFRWIKDRYTHAVYGWW